MRHIAPPCRFLALLSSTLSNAPQRPSAMTMASDKLQSFALKPRTFILSDISDGSNDVGSLCRYLLYANQFKTEGLVACTSARVKDQVSPQHMHKIVDAYEGVVDNLNQHVHPDAQYPSADSLRKLIKKGAEVCSCSFASIAFLRQFILILSS